MEKTQLIKKATLDGTKFLRVERVISTFEMISESNSDGSHSRAATKQLIEEKVENLEFALTEITTEELKEYRINKVPSFLLKVDGKLYYSKMPEDINLFSCNLLGDHLCSHGNVTCKRLSAASDQDGGCAKVRSRSTKIEKYPWITTGYETFNTEHDSFIVIHCKHYKECPSREPINVSETNRIHLETPNFTMIV